MPGKIVGAQIETMHDEGVFGQGEVAAFIRQYLVAVDRLIGPEESDADYFRKLLDNHHSLLRKAFRAAQQAPDPHGEPSADPTDIPPGPC